MQNEKIVAPRVHLNGTARSTLMRVHLDAANAVLRALEAVGQTAPHPRDFCFGDSTAYKTARHQHSIRIARLRAVHQELQVIAEDIDRQ